MPTENTPTAPTREPFTGKLTAEEKRRIHEQVKLHLELTPTTPEPTTRDEEILSRAD